MGLLENSFCQRTEGPLTGCCQETEGPLARCCQETEGPLAGCCQETEGSLASCCQETEGPLAGCSSALQFSPLKCYMDRFIQLHAVGESWQLHFSGLRRIPLWKSNACHGSACGWVIYKFHLVATEREGTFIPTPISTDRCTPRFMYAFPKHL